MSRFLFWLGVHGLLRAMRQFELCSSASICRLPARRGLAGTSPRKIHDTIDTTAQSLGSYLQCSFSTANSANLSACGDGEASLPTDALSAA